MLNCHNWGSLIKYLKISTCMKVISLKIFVEGYLATIRGWQAELGSVTISEGLHNHPSLGVVPGPPTSESSWLFVKNAESQATPRLNELEFLGAVPKNFHFCIHQGFCITSNIDKVLIHLWFQVSVMENVKFF